MCLYKYFYDKLFCSRFPDILIRLSTCEWEANGLDSREKSWVGLKRGLEGGKLTFFFNENN